MPVRSWLGQPTSTSTRAAVHLFVNHTNDEQSANAKLGASQLVAAPYTQASKRRCLQIDILAVEGVGDSLEREGGIRFTHTTRNEPGDVHCRPGPAQNRGRHAAHRGSTIAAAALKRGAVCPAEIFDRTSSDILRRASK